MSPDQIIKLGSGEVRRLTQLYSADCIWIDRYEAFFTAREGVKVVVAYLLHKSKMTSHIVSFRACNNLHTCVYNLQRETQRCKE